MQQQQQKQPEQVIRLAASQTVRQSDRYTDIQTDSESAVILAVSFHAQLVV